MYLLPTNLQYFFQFQTDCMYYWAHTEVPKTKPNDIGKLTPSWPPPLQISEEDLQAGRKFTEAGKSSLP